MDENKHTALNTAVVFYFLNGHRFGYDDEIRSLRNQFGTDQATVEETTAIESRRFAFEAGVDVADTIRNG